MRRKRIERLLFPQEDRSFRNDRLVAGCFMLRRIVLIIGALLTAGMLLYPPWLHVSGSYSSGTADFPGRHSHSYGEYHAGYHPLFRPPYDESRVNVQLLLLQIGSAGLVTWFIYVALNRRERVS